MCETCWTERGGHKIINEKTIKAAELIQAIYDSEDGGAGGYAHIVVDDWNLDDSSINFSLSAIKKGDLSEDTGQACNECLTFMKGLSYEERVSAMGLQNEYFNINQG
jgi:hypothetical protein